MLEICAAALGWSYVRFVSDVSGLNNVHRFTTRAVDLELEIGILGTLYYIETM